MRLLPRLADGAAGLVYEEVAGLASQEAQALVGERDNYERLIRFASVGGERQDSVRWGRELGSELLEIGIRCGYPESLTAANKKRFDLECAVLLHERLQDSIPGERIRKEPWQYLCCAQVPGLVIWRFPGKDGGAAPRERFIGWTRSALARLWWRAHLLVRPEAEHPYQLIDQEAGGLNEDNFVALLERPWTAAHRELNVALASEYIKRRSDVVGVSRPASLPDDARWNPVEDLFRDAMKRVIRMSAYVSWNAMSERQLRAEVRRLVGQSAMEIRSASMLSPEAAASLTVRESSPEDDFEALAGTETIQG